MTDALRALRERYRATSVNAIGALRRLARQLAAAPDSPEMIEALRRELHRIHGSAGTYGFPEASHLAAQLEERAIAWAGNPALDRERRAAMTQHFAAALEARLGLHAAAAEGPGHAAPQPASGASAAAASRTSGATTGADTPTAEASTPSRRTSGDTPRANGPHAAAAPDIVLVEDDPALVDMLRYALDASGFSFVHYATGIEAHDALVRLETHGRRPVILLDIDLPGLDGFSLHERLRVERPDAFATVFLTARTGEAEQLRAYRAGAIDYVPKPVNVRILMAKIPSWLDRTRRA